MAYLQSISNQTQEYWQLRSVVAKDLIITILNRFDLNYINQFNLTPNKYQTERQYWQITTNKETILDDSTWLVMTKIPNLKYKDVGDIYKARSYEEQGFRNSKNELGWADFGLINYSDIQKWWELVMSAYLMVYLHHKTFNPSVAPIRDTYQQHALWDSGKG